MRPAIGIRGTANDNSMLPFGASGCEAPTRYPMKVALLLVITDSMGREYTAGCGRVVSVLHPKLPNNLRSQRHTNRRPARLFR